MNSITFTVTQDHLDRDARARRKLPSNICMSCAVAEALQDVGVTRPRVIKGGLYLNTKEHDIGDYKALVVLYHDDPLFKFIEAVDAGMAQDLVPATFTIEDKRQ